MEMEMEEDEEEEGNFYVVTRPALGEAITSTVPSQAGSLRISSQKAPGGQPGPQRVGTRTGTISLPQHLLGQVGLLPPGLRHQDLESAPSDGALRDQLLLGLRDGPLAQALKVYARRNPDLDFADLRQEALLLDSDYGHPRPEVTCSAINKQYGSPRPPQDIDWKEQLKREIMDDVQAQMKGLTKDIVAELKPLLQSASPQPSSPNPTWNRPYSPRPYNDRDEQGRPICHRCRKAGRFKKLGRLYYIDDSDVHGTNDLALTVEEDGVVQVALVNANVEPLSSELPAEKSILGDRPDLSAQQQGELHALLQKWESVFAQHKEDFGRTNIVQHRIPTGDAAPTREVSADSTHAVQGDEDPPRRYARTGGYTGEL
uniref:Uncharacterized protein n=1 Tax=Knipowitschia caucasica TaxID=637954 RepID=A0AAV2KYS3_KNICA